MTRALADTLSFQSFNVSHGGSDSELLGMLADPTWLHLKDSLAERAFDKRWLVNAHIATRGGTAVSGLVTSRCTTASLPDANIRQEMELRFPPGFRDRDARKVLFLGGHAHLRGGFSTPAGLAADRSASQLIHHVLREPGVAAVEPVALYVPDGQVNSFRQAWTGDVQIIPAPDTAVLDTSGDWDNLDHYLRSMKKSHRRNWLRDRPRLTDLGIMSRPTTISLELLSESAPLIVDVKARNGVADHVRTTEIRLRNWYARSDHRYSRAWTVRSKTGQLVAISIGVVRDQVLHMTEIGIRGDRSDRSEVYLCVGFHGPLDTCLVERLRALELGSGHLGPKLHRGATRVTRSHVIPRSAPGSGDAEPENHDD